MDLWELKASLVYDFQATQGYLSRPFLKKKKKGKKKQPGNDLNDQGHLHRKPNFTTSTFQSTKVASVMSGPCVKSGAIINQLNQAWGTTHHNPSPWESKTKMPKFEIRL